MTKHVQDDKPPMIKEAKAWMEQEIEAQEARYKTIVEEIDGIEEQRAEWIEEFLSLIQTRGFHITGDMTRKVAKEEIPEKPDRPDAMRVIW
jgi:hypothetical protein